MTNKGIVTDIHVGDVLANVADIHIVGHRAAMQGHRLQTGMDGKSVGPHKDAAETAQRHLARELHIVHIFGSERIGHPQVAPVVGTAALLCQSIYLVVSQCSHQSEYPYN
jgi:hypothetical protein